MKDPVKLERGESLKKKLKVKEKARMRQAAEEEASKM
jgi:hypothetical protein